MAVASQCHILLFIEHSRLYNGLQLKAVVSYICLQSRKLLPVEIRQTNSLTQIINMCLVMGPTRIRQDGGGANGSTGGNASRFYV